MPNDYPIRFTAQLRQHLREIRKARNMTQKQLGELIGVSQARIAEIEANPGLVNLEQLIQLLSVLNVTLYLNENSTSPNSNPNPNPSSNSVFIPQIKKGMW